MSHPSRVIMKWFGLIFVLFLIIPFTIAQNEVEIKFNNVDKTDLTNHVLTIKVGKDVQKSVLKSNIHKVTLSEGEYDIEVIIDNKKTPTPDYFGKKKINHKSSPSYGLLVFPIGYVEGTVIDLKGNLVPGANVKFTCYTTEDTVFLKETDRTGFLSIPNIPVSQCMATAYDGDYAGMKKFTVKMGQPTSIQITLDKKIERTNYWVIVGVVVIILIISLGIYFLKRKKVSKKTKKEVIKEEPKVSNETKEPILTKTNNTTETIIKTLTEKEKKVVEFLIESNNKASQAKIRHATHVPRTSLSRVLKKLEKKNLVTIEKHGKMVEVTLTDFFLGHE